MTAIVTGAARGIGKAVADRLAAHHDVLRVDLDPGDHILVADVTDPEGRAKIVEAAGEVDVLVNNAGITRDARALAMTPEDYALVIRVNLVAPLRLAEMAGPRLADGGSVVNIASRAALGNFGQANYVTAKSGLIGATRALAMRWAPRVRVNAVAPGLVDTPMTRAIPPAVYEKLVARVPAGRAGAPEEIAEAVAFLASPRSSYVTGQVLLACGGRSVAG
jgi:NAD(P)-dependent dehydrogenase (short-subunit alcohol dehydrogenase family)